MPRVVVVGDLMTDAIARAGSALIKGSDTPSAVSMHGGGSGANVAAWLAVEGTDTAFVGKRGADVTGRTRDIELMGYGVDARMVMDSDHLTGSCIVMITHKGDLTMLSDPAANAALTAEDLPKDLFAGNMHLHLSGYTLLHEGSRATGQAALSLARQQRMSVSVDTASFAPLERAGAEAFLEWTAPAKLCLTDVTEARVLSGAESAEEAARHLVAHYSQVVVTEGSNGALWLGQGKSDPVRVEAEHIPEMVDATGAGDAFCAGFLPPWLAGKAPADALASGCRVAAEARVHVGGRPPT